MTNLTEKIFNEVVEQLEYFNEQNNLSHRNSEVYTLDNEIYSIIEGENHTTLTITFNEDDIVSMIRQGVNKVIKWKYESAIDEFDIDDYFNELWSIDFAKHNNYTPREFIKILEDDYQQFQEIQY